MEREWTRKAKENRKRKEEEKRKGGGGGGGRRQISHLRKPGELMVEASLQEQEKIDVSPQ